MVHEIRLKASLEASFKVINEIVPLIQSGSEMASLNQKETLRHFTKEFTELGNLTIQHVMITCILTYTGNGVNIE